ESSLLPRAEYELPSTSPFTPVAACTPGTSSVRSATLRPLSGSASTRFVSTVSFKVALLVSTAMVGASIETLVEISPTSSVTSTRRLSLTWSTIPVCSYFLKPGCVTETRYSPTGRTANKNWPSEFAVAVRAWLVAICSAVMVAPGGTAVNPGCTSLLRPRGYARHKEHTHQT